MCPLQRVETSVSGNIFHQQWTNIFRPNQTGSMQDWWNKSSAEDLFNFMICSEPGQSDPELDKNNWEMSVLCWDLMGRAELNLNIRIELRAHTDTLCGS